MRSPPASPSSPSYSQQHKIPPSPYHHLLFDEFSDSADIPSSDHEEFKPPASMRMKLLNGTTANGTNRRRRRYRLRSQKSLQNPQKLRKKSAHLTTETPRGHRRGHRGRASRKDHHGFSSARPSSSMMNKIGSGGRSSLLSTSSGESEGAETKSATSRGRGKRMMMKRGQRAAKLQNGHIMMAGRGRGSQHRRRGRGRGGGCEQQTRKAATEDASSSSSTSISDAEDDEDDTAQHRRRGRGREGRRAEDERTRKAVQQEDASSSSEAEDDEGVEEDDDFDDTALFSMASSDDDEAAFISSDEDDFDDDGQVESPRGNSLVVSPRPPSSATDHHQIVLNSPPPPPHPVAVVTPKRRGRKERNHHRREPYDLRRSNGTSSTPPKRRKARPMPPAGADLSNPYEGLPEPMDLYQRKMRDAIILYRYMGMPDRDPYAFCGRPVSKPFLTRNLHYMRRQRPPALNYKASVARLSQQQDMVEEGLEKNKSKDTNDGHDHRQNGIGETMGESRTSSRVSNRLPATIRPTFIRNNLFFGHKTAIVQCFHLPEINNKLGLMKRIPSATFEMKVNERIRNISIDLPDDLHAGVLDGGDKAKSEYLVVRVVFRFEDKEIGGHHLRKTASRLSASSSMSDTTSHSLRKNGPMEAQQVVMFGSKRIFCYKPGADLKVINDEASIALFTADELHVNDLDTKSSAGQLGRLISASARPSSPFISIMVRSHDDSDDEEEEDEKEKEEDEGRMRKKRRINEEEEDEDEEEGGRKGISLRDALEMMDIDMAEDLDVKEVTSNNNSDMLERLPKQIALKFWIRQPGGLSRSQTGNRIPPMSPGTSPPRGRLRQHNATHLSSSTDDYDNHQRQSIPSCSSYYNNSNSMQQSPDFFTANALFSDLDSSSLSSPSGPQFVIRSFPTSHCFFCLVPLPLRTLWALLKHLRFCHPRFQFTFESSIRVGSSEHRSLPGFAISQNRKFDPSFELRPMRNGELFGGADALRNRLSKRAGGRPAWLVTKALAKKVLTIDDFPIERYTTVATGGLSTGEDYVRCMGRFDFGTPTVVDQPWMVQLSSRKLNDITDLHHAECAMMQMWNTFLLRVRITLFGQRMLYKALRIFVKHHWRQLTQQHLRTHFLLHLTCLLNTGSIDAEERYDLARRLEPDYDPARDKWHVAGRELAMLEEERLRGAVQPLPRAADPEADQKAVVINGKNGGGDQKQQRHCTRNGGSGGGGDQSPVEKMQTRPRNHSNNMIEQQPHRSRKPSLSPPSATATVAAVSQSQVSPGAPPRERIKSLQALRARYPFAASKRIALVWKFLQDYDFPNIGEHRGGGATVAMATPTTQQRSPDTVVAAVLNNSRSRAAIVAPRRQ